MISLELLIFLVLLQNSTVLVPERKSHSSCIKIEGGRESQKERALNLALTTMSMIFSFMLFYGIFFKIMLFPKNLCILVDVFQVHSLVIGLYV